MRASRRRSMSGVQLRFHLHGMVQSFTLRAKSCGPASTAFLPDARAVDALHLAGGPTKSADLVAVNLAAVVEDGTEIVVPARGTSNPSVVSGGAARSRVARSHRRTRTTTHRRRNVPRRLTAARTIARRPPSISTRPDAAALETLPGIGPALAARIVEFRSVNGAFASTDELLGRRRHDAKQGRRTYAIRDVLVALDWRKKAAPERSGAAPELRSAVYQPPPESPPAAEVAAAAATEVAAAAEAAAVTGSRRRSSRSRRRRRCSCRLGRHRLKAAGVLCDRRISSDDARILDAAPSQTAAAAIKEFVAQKRAAEGRRAVRS